MLLEMAHNYVWMFSRSDAVAMETNVFHLLRQRLCVKKCNLWRMNMKVSCSDVIRGTKKGGMYQRGRGNKIRCADSKGKI
jgi:hypothetical protein